MANENSFSGKENDSPEEASIRKFVDEKIQKVTHSNGENVLLRKFFSELTENIRFKNFEERYASGETPNYSLEEDKLKNISRDELGKLLIDMAKEAMEESGSVPEENNLIAIYENKFGNYLQACDLFDLEIIAKENEIIQEMAKEKNIQNVVSLTEAFKKFIDQKRTAKEQKIRQYLAQKLSSKTNSPIEEAK